jgi:hypothetical protein
LKIKRLASADFFIRSDFGMLPNRKNNIRNQEAMIPAIMVSRILSLKMILTFPGLKKLKLRKT